MSFIIIWNFVKRYWKPLTVCLMLVCSFFLGRKSVYKNVDQSMTKTTTVATQVNDHTQSSDKTVDQENKNQNVHVVIVTVHKPDGTTVTKETKDTNTKETSEQVEIKYVDRIHTVTQIVEKQVQVEKRVTVPLRSDYIVGLTVGTNFSNLKKEFSTPSLDPLLFGLHGERRIIGPFYLGLWGMTNSKFNNVSGGVSLDGVF